MISGFLAIVLLWILGGIALLHGLFRSVMQPDPDKIRPSGPIF